MSCASQSLPLSAREETCRGISEQDGNEDALKTPRCNPSRCMCLYVALQIYSLPCRFVEFGYCEDMWLLAIRTSVE
jgi:hypothetical protein